MRMASGVPCAWCRGYHARGVFTPSTRVSEAVLEKHPNGQGNEAESREANKAEARQASSHACREAGFVAMYYHHWLMRAKKGRSPCRAPREATLLSGERQANISLRSM